jgi:hypothetical protein
LKSDFPGLSPQSLVGGASDVQTVGRCYLSPGRDETEHLDPDYLLPVFRLVCGRYQFPTLSILQVLNRTNSAEPALFRQYGISKDVI